MSDEMVALQARVRALEWAVYHLVLVLSAAKDASPHTALPYALHMAVDRASAHKALIAVELQALTRLADDLADIPAEWPEFLKQLRRDWPT